MPDTIRVPQPGDVWTFTRIVKRRMVQTPVLVTGYHQRRNYNGIIYTDGSAEEVVESEARFIREHRFYATADDLMNRTVVSSAAADLLASPSARRFLARPRPAPEEPPPEHRPTQWEFLLSDDDE